MRENEFGTLVIDCFKQGDRLIWCRLMPVWLYSSDTLQTTLPSPQLSWVIPGSNHGFCQYCQLHFFVDMICLILKQYYCNNRYLFSVFRSGNQINKGFVHNFFIRFTVRLLSRDSVKDLAYCISTAKDLHRFNRFKIFLVANLDLYF